MFGKFGQNAAPASAVSGLHHGEHEERKENKTIQIIINFVLLILLCKIHSLIFLFQSAQTVSHSASCWPHEVEWWLGWCSTPMIAEIAMITQDQGSSDQGEHVANFAILSTKCYLM